MHPDLEWIFYFQAYKDPILTSLAHFFSLVDTIWFLIIFIPIVWFFFNKECGATLLYGIVISIVFNHFLKIYFQVPRPNAIDPGISMTQTFGYSFPSGAAQGIVVLLAIIWTYIRGWRSIPLFCLIALCVGASRVYLGAHYLNDVLVGFAVGALFSFVYLSIIPLVTDVWKQVPHWTQFLFAAFAPFALLLADSEFVIYSFVAALSGVGIGFFLKEIAPIQETVPGTGDFFNVLGVGWIVLLHTFALFSFYNFTHWSIHILYFVIGFSLSYGIEKARSVYFPS